MSKNILDFFRLPKKDTESRANFLLNYYEDDSAVLEMAELVGRNKILKDLFTLLVKDGEDQKTKIELVDQLAQVVGLMESKIRSKTEIPKPDP